MSGIKLIQDVLAPRDVSFLAGATLEIFRCQVVIATDINNIAHMVVEALRGEFLVWTGFSCESESPHSSRHPQEKRLSEVPVWVGRCSGLWNCRRMPPQLQV